MVGLQYGTKERVTTVERLSTARQNISMEGICKEEGVDAICRMISASGFRSQIV